MGLWKVEGFSGGEVGRGGEKKPGDSKA